MLPAGLPFDVGRRACRPGSRRAGRPRSPASVAARSPVHIFSTPSTSTGRSSAMAASDAEVQRRGAPGTRVVDVDDRDVAQAGLAQPGLAPDAPLVVEPAPERRCRRRPGRARRVTPASARASCDDLEGHLLGREVPPAHVRHAGAEDGHWLLVIRHSRNLWLANLLLAEAWGPARGLRSASGGGGPRHSLEVTAADRRPPP